MAGQGRLIYFDYFRAMSIMLVVISHCYLYWPIDRIYEKAAVNIMSGASGLFVFASGFFFRHIYVERDFRYINVIRDKSAKLIIPYLLLSLTYMIVATVLGQDIRFSSSAAPGETHGMAYSVIMNLLTGRTLTAYWFIPFLMVMFLASHIFKYVDEQSNRTTIAIMAVLFVVATLINRPDRSINIWQAVVYFAPFYMLGMFYHKNLAYFTPLLTNRTLLFFSVSLSVLFAFAIAYMGYDGNVVNAHFSISNQLDYMVMEKLLNLVALLQIAKWLERYELPLLTYIGKISFQIFFVHAIVLALEPLFPMGFVSQGGVRFLLTFAAVFSLSVLAIALIKRVFGNRSKYLIG